MNPSSPLSPTSPLPFPLSPLSRLTLFVVSLVIVAFGQPSTLPLLGPLAAACGLALFWRLLLAMPSAKKRFWLSTLWYTAVILIQFSWMLAISHAFKYIYLLYPLLSLLLYGVPWGIIGLYITPVRAAKPLFPLFIAAVWTCLEWSRLFILTGSSWNPVGLFLATTPYTLQMASWIGVYGLSFWVTMTNAIVLQAVWVTPKRFTRACALSAIVFPYLLGMATLLYHREGVKRASNDSLTLLLVQPAFPVEEWLPGWGAHEALDMAFKEWKAILILIAPYEKKHVDLLVLPENAVPFGAHSPLFLQTEIETLFSDVLGEAASASLPLPTIPFAHPVQMLDGVVWVVSHSYILQGISNWLSAGVVAGLEDRVMIDGKLHNSTSAFYYTPQTSVVPLLPEKYDKRILVPGEYIPFAFLAPFLREYGIQDSLLAGEQAKTFLCQHAPFGLSICYEETYGHIMRENRHLGARFLVNLTNDGWYPRSNLPEQHFQHARLRTVEMGIPLVRATNTGVTASVSSLGVPLDRIQHHDTPGVLLTTLPLHHYATFYTYAGDWTILLCSAFSILAYLFPHLHLMTAWSRKRFYKKTFCVTDKI